MHHRAEGWRGDNRWRRSDTQNAAINLLQVLEQPDNLRTKAPLCTLKVLKLLSFVSNLHQAKKENKDWSPRLSFTCTFLLFKKFQNVKIIGTNANILHWKSNNLKSSRRHFLLSILPLGWLKMECVVSRFAFDVHYYVFAVLVNALVGSTGAYSVL